MADISPGPDSTASALRGLAALAAVLGGLGVVLGAFGAHALRGHVDDTLLQAWHTAVEYQVWHALAALIVATQARAVTRARLVCWLFLAGCVLFCGSLYAIVLGAPRAVGVITPVGGVAWIAGWALLAWSWWRPAPRS